MKKSIRLIIQGAVQNMFFEQFMKEHTKELNVRGFMRKLEDGKIEVFLEGDNEKVEQMILLAKTGPQHTQIRNVEERPERFQDFKDFKIIRI